MRAGGCYHLCFPEQRFGFGQYPQLLTDIISHHHSLEKAGSPIRFFHFSDPFVERKVVFTLDLFEGSPN